MPQTNPYLSAKRAWNTHTQGLMHAVTLWQCIAISSLLITLAAVAGLISIAHQSKFIPLVFQQDAHGNTLSITRADHLQQANHNDYQTAAARFIEHLRMVSSDQALQKKAVFQVYAYLKQNNAALRKVQDFYHEPSSNPFIRTNKETVNIAIQSVLQESTHTWQVAWTETVHNRDGSSKTKPYAMKAMVTLYQDPSIENIPNESLLHNPHLIYVRDFNWSYDLKSEEIA